MTQELLLDTWTVGRYTEEDEPDAPIQYVGHTCNAVDRGLSMLKRLDDQFEIIRDANADLRDWGLWWKYKAMARKEALNAQAEQIDRLKDENAALKASNIQLLDSIEVLRQHNDRLVPRLPESFLLPTQEKLDTGRQGDSADLRGSLARCDGRDLEVVRLSSDDPLV